jgi:copper chaperone CopZ
MKKVLILVLLTLTPGFAVAEEIRVTVNGMVCSFCAQGIKKTFGKLPEVASVSPDLENKVVVIVSKEAQHLPDEKIKELIRDAGYDVTAIERKP